MRKALVIAAVGLCVFAASASAATSSPRAAANRFITGTTQDLFDPETGRSRVDWCEGLEPEEILGYPRGVLVCGVQWRGLIEGQDTQCVAYVVVSRSAKRKLWAEYGTDEGALCSSGGVIVDPDHEWDF